MKKIILFFLLIAGTGNFLHAQDERMTAYDIIYDSPKPGQTGTHFVFHLPGPGLKKIVLEFSYVSQLEHIPNLDSLVKTAIAMLEPLKDSLKADGMVRRVDVVLMNLTPKIRIVSHPEFSNSYTVKDKELLQLKINQDTIRIVGFASSRRVVTFNTDGKKEEKQPKFPFTISILVNNIADATSLPGDIMQQCVTLLRPKVERYFVWDRRDNTPIDFNAEFNMRTGQPSMPINPFFKKSDKAFNGLVGFSLSAVRGSIVPGFQAGFEYKKGNGSFYNKWRLFFENQAFFSRDAANKLTIDNNNFIVFQLLQNSIRAKQSTGFVLEGNLTLGYLFRRTGEWYEKNTVKLGLPVLVSKHIMIEPQFTFNGWFKNMSPSIKISFNF